jgi:fumarate reductase subunit D
MPNKQLTMREKGNILIKLQENIKVGNNSISAIFPKCHVLCKIDSLLHKAKFYAPLINWLYHGFAVLNI